ncbi:MAG: hypothetical protein LBR74_03210 [Eubacterium sp.]|nr:hypothetical protein [Eubacterium sp.]
MLTLVKTLEAAMPQMFEKKSSRTPISSAFSKAASRKPRGVRRWHIGGYLNGR